ncbi:hypothetical protein EJ02DRAFT_469704 [Clathrospora elynae]|uniref:Uncharacterized protein n=1 Tax=Clathrospora elynae TaxID=706981 RepID=A0A6A5SBT2_9PLEO|nr:hypothetical protein EJ02DRAFT_469704 [Clathrospora elynae]
MDSKIAPPHTPIARRAEPVVKLLAAVCLHCSKRIREGGEACSKAHLKKCAYCAKLKKSCNAVPPDFHRDVNVLLRSHGKVAAAVGVRKQLLLKGFTQARRSYVANVEAFRGMALLGDLDAPTDVNEEMANLGNNKVADLDNSEVANRVDNVPSSGGLLTPTPKRKSKAKAKEKGKGKARDRRRRQMEATEDKDSEPVSSLRCPAHSRKAGSCASRRI